MASRKLAYVGNGFQECLTGGIREFSSRDPTLFVYFRFGSLWIRDIGGCRLGGCSSTLLNLEHRCITELMGNF